MQIVEDDGLVCKGLDDQFVGHFNHPGLPLFHRLHPGPDVMIPQILLELRKSHVP